MDMIYRPMHLSDVESVWQLIEVLKAENGQVSLVEIPDKDELVSWLSNENLLLYIAETESQTVGLLKAARGNEPGKRHAAFLSIAVHPQFRNQGVARELTNTGLEDMKKDGVTIARAYIYSDNLSSINTILRLNFTFAGSVLRHHYDEKSQQYVDDLIFHKIL